MALDQSPRQIRIQCEEAGLEPTLKLLARGSFGRSGDELYGIVKEWCDDKQSLQSTIDSNKSISLAKDSNAIALEANNLAESANILASLADERASRAESRARAAIYIALATLIIQALPYIKSIIVNIQTS